MCTHILHTDTVTYMINDKANPLVLELNAWCTLQHICNLNCHHYVLALTVVEVGYCWNHTVC